MSLTFNEFSETNRKRGHKWHADGEPWIGSDWSNAAAGEMGEACNVVKKLRRIETSTVSRPGEQNELVLRTKLANEIADTMIYLDLLADYYGLNLEAAIKGKFNQTSIEFGFEERL